MDDALGFMANLNRGLGFGAPVVAGVNAARDVVTGNSGPNLFQTYRDELAAQNDRAASFATSSPFAAALGRGLGSATIAGLAPANLFAPASTAMDARALGGVTTSIGGGMLGPTEAGPNFNQALQHRAKQIMDATPGLSEAERSVLWGLVTGNPPRAASGLATHAAPPPQASQDVRDLFGTIDAGNPADLASAHRSLLQSSGPAASGLRRIIATRLDPAALSQAP